MRLKLLPSMFVFAAQYGATVAHAQWSETNYYLDTYTTPKTVNTSTVNNTGVAQVMSFGSYEKAYTRIVLNTGSTFSTEPYWRSGFTTLQDDSDVVFTYGGNYNVLANSRLVLIFTFNVEEGQNAWFNSSEFGWASRSRLWETWDNSMGYGYTLP